MKRQNGRYAKEVDDLKRDLLKSALEDHGSMRKAAKWLGISVATVSRDCKLLGITLQTSKPRVLVRREAK